MSFFTDPDSHLSHRAALVVTVRFVHSLEQDTTFLCGVYGEGYSDQNNPTSGAIANISYSYNEIDWAVFDGEGPELSSRTSGPANTLSAEHEWYAVRIYCKALRSLLRSLLTLTCCCILLVPSLRRTGGALAPSS